jgi:Holliday junction DNA helicase RuvA
VRVPGVGKKTAERLLVELKDRFKAWETSPAMFALVSDGPLPVASVSAEADAVSALVSLGYKPQEASKAIAAIKDKAGLSSEELIRRSLKGMITK